MPRNSNRNRSTKRAPSPLSLRRRGKPKFCVFCRDGVAWVDYKDVALLRRFLSDRAKIKARRATGACKRHQREVATAIKTARELALLPYTQRTVTDKVAARGGRRGWGAAPAGRPGAGTPPETPAEQLPPGAERPELPDEVPTAFDSVADAAEQGGLPEEG